MSNHRTLSLTVDDLRGVEVRGALPGGLSAAATKVVEISEDVLRANIRNSLEVIGSILNEVELDAGGFQLDTVRFTLKVDAAGEVSLMSVAKGSITGQTGLEFSITRKRD